jgi:hypothetical protein
MEAGFSKFRTAFRRGRHFRAEVWDGACVGVRSGFVKEKGEGLDGPRPGEESRRMAQCRHRDLPPDGFVRITLKKTYAD